MINPFIVIVDKEGDVVDTLSSKSTIDYILDMVRIYDQKYPDDVPHTAYNWNNGNLEKITDIIVNSGKLLASRPAKGIE